MKKPIEYTDEPMELEIIEDFLPPPGQLHFKKNTPTITYESEKDLLQLLYSDAKVAKRVRVEPGVVKGYDSAGGLVATWVSNASRLIENPESPDLPALEAALNNKNRPPMDDRGTDGTRPGLFKAASSRT